MKNNEVKEIFVPCKYIKDDGTILDFTGLYEVSSLGRVRSLNYNHTGKVRVLNQGTVKAKDGSIWHQVVLSKNGKKYPMPTHRLVLSSFDQEGWSENAVADHIIPRDENTCCDSLSNLRWFTRRDNVSTDHCKTRIIKKLSKQVRVTLPDGTLQYFPSAHEAERSLSLPYNTIWNKIQKYNGYYKKLNLHFAYVL